MIHRGFIWTPGRGFVKVPPRSPLLTVLELLSEYEALQTLKANERGALLEQLKLESLSKIRDHLSSVIETRQQFHVPAPLSERQID